MYYSYMTRVGTLVTQLLSSAAPALLCSSRSMPGDNEKSSHLLQIRPFGRYPVPLQALPLAGNAGSGLIDNSMVIIASMGSRLRQLALLGVFAGATASEPRLSRCSPGADAHAAGELISVSGA